MARIESITINCALIKGQVVTNNKKNVAYVAAQFFPHQVNQKTYDTVGVGRNFYLANGTVDNSTLEDGDVTLYEVVPHAVLGRSMFLTVDENVSDGDIDAEIAKIEDLDLAGGDCVFRE